MLIKTNVLPLYQTANPICVIANGQQTPKPDTVEYVHSFSGRTPERPGPTVLTPLIEQEEENSACKILHVGLLMVMI